MSRPRSIPLACLLVFVAGFAYAATPAFATETIVYESDGLYLVGEGEETTKILSEAPDGFGVSPDGEQIVFSPYYGEYEGGVIIEDVGSKELHFISVPEESEMWWSEVRYGASGEQIIGRAYSQATETAGIYAMDTDGSNLRKLVSGGAWPVMSSQGALAYLSSVDGQSDLYVVDPSPSGHSPPRKLAGSGFYGSSGGRISFSPDGDSILFPRENDHVYSVSVATGKATLLPLLSGGSEWETAKTVLDAASALYRRNLETHVSTILASSPSAYWVRTNQPFGEAEPPAAFQPPSCGSSASSAVVNGSAWIEFPCTGPELEYEIDSSPSHGSLVEFEPKQGGFLYQPDPGFTGGDSVTFHAVNDDGESESGTVDIEVAAAECEAFGVGTQVEEPVGINLRCWAPWIEPESEEEEWEEEPLSFEILSGPAHGELSGLDVSRGEVTYVPDSEFEGSDEFTYRASDGHGAAEAKRVEVVVGGEPSCEGFAAHVEPGEPAALDLKCDRAVGSSSYFEVTSNPTHGSLHEFDEERGTLVYRPKALFLGQDSFKFRAVNWAGESTEATATIDVCGSPELEVSGDLSEPEAPGVELDLDASPGYLECEIDGHGSEITSLEVIVDDELAYSEERQCGSGESFCGRAGMGRQVQLPYQAVIGSHDYRVEAEDQFGGRSESETWTKSTSEEGTVVNPVAEDSKVECKSEDPKVLKHPYRAVNGVVQGTHCADLIPPIKGAKTYRGRGGDDRIFAGAGANLIRGGEGDDVVFGGRGNDKVYGEKGKDRLVGGSGDDKLEGEAGDDTLVGGAGADVIEGGDENDLVKGGTTVDELHGGGGENTLSFADGVTPGFKLYPGGGALTELPSWFPDKHGRRGVYVNLSAAPVIVDNGEVARFGGGFDRIPAADFQNVIGTPFDDLIVGSSGENKIEAGPGIDVVRGAGGADEIYGGADEDYLQGPGDLDGGAGTDVCLSSAETSECDSSDPEATLTQPGEEEIEVGLLGAGVPGAPPDVYVIGSSTADEVKASWAPGALTLIASGAGKNRFRVSGTETGCKVESATEATCAVDVAQTLTMSGGGGADRLIVHDLTKDTSVSLLGGSGGDHLIGGGDTDDVLSDGAGGDKDVLSGHNGDDSLFYSEGADELNGGAGNDLFISASVCDGDTIRGGHGSDNANWAQLAGDELQPEDDEFPSDVKDHTYAQIAHGVKALLAPGTVVQQKKGCPSGKDHISGVESLEGSHGHDILVGNEETNVLLGRAGRDVLLGKGGDDNLLAANRKDKKKDPDEIVTKAERIDEDIRLNCGAGDGDTLKMDPRDRGHQEFCDGHVTVAARGSENRVQLNLVGPEGALDEEVIGEANSPGLLGPLAFYRLDDATGTAAVNWGDEGLEEDAEISEEVEELEETELEEEEAEEESGEELEELAEEEPEEEAEDEGPGAGEVHPGEFGGEPELGASGALAESEAVRLDGVDDYLDLTDNWDPALFTPQHCETLGGYSVELWVRFGAEPETREELFSRSEDGEGLFLYRDSDGRIRFSVAGATESPRVSTYAPVADDEWHQVVATLADEEECIASRSFGLRDGESALSAPEMTLTVDGFPYSLGLDHPPYPVETPEAPNIVGARDSGAGLTNWLEGTVDDIAIYGEPLEQSEIQFHLAASEVSPAPVLLEPSAPLADYDEDGVADNSDNCVATANGEQDDSDLDGIGDACQPEPDSDEDGVADEADNCPDEPNPLQEDEDEDGVGDICEAIE